MMSTVMTETRKQKRVAYEAPNKQILLFKFVYKTLFFGVLGDCLPLKLRINGGGGEKEIV